MADFEAGFEEAYGVGYEGAVDDTGGIGRTEVKEVLTSTHVVALSCRAKGVLHQRAVDDA